MSATEKALALLKLGDPNALVDYIERWQKKPHHDARYVIDVVRVYHELGVQQREPDRVVGKLRVIISNQRVEWCGVDIDLTLTEFRVVKLLTDHTDAFITYRTIYDIIQCTGFIAGCGPDGYRTNVRSCIKRIRRKFTQVDASFDAIVNYQSVGYRWVASAADRAVPPVVDGCATPRDEPIYNGADGTRYE